MGFQGPTGGCRRMQIDVSGEELNPRGFFLEHEGQRCYHVAAAAAHLETDLRPVLYESRSIGQEGVDQDKRVVTRIIDLRMRVDQWDLSNACGSLLIGDLEEKKTD